VTSTGWGGAATAAVTTVFFAQPVKTSARLKLVVRRKEEGESRREGTGENQRFECSA
jgi:hypothetical protein